MTGFVLDASALLALLLGEPGADKVKSGLDGSVMTTVSLAEVVSHYAKLGAARHDIEAILRPLPIRLASVNAALSYDAAHRWNGQMPSTVFGGGTSPLAMMNLPAASK